MVAMAITRFEAAPVLVPSGIRLPTRETRRVPVLALSSSVSAAAAKVSSRPNGRILRRGILGYVVDGLLGLGSNAALGHGGAGQGPLPLTGSDFSFYDVAHPSRALIPSLRSVHRVVVLHVGLLGSVSSLSVVAVLVDFVAVRERRASPG